MTYSLIKFPASFVDHNGNRRTEVAEFKLGPGPCGKTVDGLNYRLDDHRNLLVMQTCSDGSAQSFHYKDSDILGRIEVHSAPRPQARPPAYR